MQFHENIDLICSDSYISAKIKSVHIFLVYFISLIDKT